MKPRHIILVAICMIGVALGTLFTMALLNHNAKESKIETIPDIYLTTVNGTGFCLSDNKHCRHTAIMFFSHDCEFCRKEIEGIIASRDTFKDTHWVFVTISPREDLEPFLIEYPLTSIKGANICVEEFPELHMALDVTAPPSLFIYDEDGHIEHYRRGAVSIQEILEWLK